MPGLPEDGSRVEAMTLPSMEYDREAERVTGILSTRQSPFGPPPNCYVDGMGVDPESVAPIGQRERHAREPDAGPDMALWEEVKAVVPAARPATLPHLCGTAGGARVYLVDGEQIKLRRRKSADSSHIGEADFMDFVEGGNGEEDSELCGKDEVYVDATLEPVAWPFVAYHECHERRDMAAGMTYDAAHERANAGEKALRAAAEKPSQTAPEPEKDRNVVSRMVRQVGRMIGLLERKDTPPTRHRAVERDAAGNIVGMVDRYGPADRHVTDASGHEHEPAGSPEGGRFTGKGGKNTPKAHAHAISELLDRGDGAGALAHFRSLPTAQANKVMSHLDGYAQSELEAASDREDVTPPAARGGKPASVEELAKSATAAAAETKTGGFGDNKVFISHVYETMKKKHPGLTMDEFKAGLVEANGRKLLTLSRADLVQAMNLEDVEASEIKHLNGRFHFILSPGERGQTRWDNDAARRVGERAVEAGHRELEEKRKRGERT